MKVLALRHPYRFTFLVYTAIWGVALVGRLAMPGVSFERRAEIVQLALAVFAAGLLAALGWWRGAGFNRPSAWRNLRLLWPPVLVLVAAQFLGGVDLPGAGELALLAVGVAITAFSEEALFRGALWHALRPTGLLRAAIITAGLFGSLHLMKLLLGGSLGETLPIVVATSLGGIAYAAIRERTASIWPIMLFHAAFNFSNGIVTPEDLPGLIAFLTIALVILFPLHGLLMLRPAWRSGRAAVTHPAARV